MGLNLKLGNLEKKHLASRKGGICEDTSEVSETAKVCTDEQKLHIEAL